ncbi:hypothetical protein [Myxococcus sp. RHSTA-1-4]|uniref:hypothetical protein n=1 Tax=Myxococcus sp. RHSTA-1-4 TaxID=2874601 RepID=UPI001CBBA798|nr:hypothetical protein [Myxococcus sp. RHSTA-1-4]MBZ4416444.1 hypothetical protein [Myxococcus sp. RHSTA-1-4]
MSRIESSPSSLQPATIDTEGASSLQSAPVPRPAPSRPAASAPGITVEVFRGPESVARESLVVTGPRSGLRTGADNGFDFAIGGSFPPQPMGNLAEQTKQMGLTASQSQAAAASRVMGDGAIVDAYARKHLHGLKESPPIQGAPTSLTDYTSSIPGVRPEVAYEYFVRNPAAVFGAADIVIRPATAALKDGARLFLEEKGIPPVWAPITVRLEPEANTVHITTLDGHPLRGTNRFVFQDDGQGGTRLRQYSAFQGSSPATSVGMALMDPIERQHDIWRSVHGHLHDSLRER